MTDTDKKSPVILQILPRLETGGVERGTVEIASALKNAGWTPVVVSGGGRMVVDLNRMGVEHITLPVYSKNYFVMRKNADTLAKLIKEKTSTSFMPDRAPPHGAQNGRLKKQTSRF